MADHQTPEEYLADCTRIEPFAIEEEFVRLPGDVAYWNARYASAYQLWLESKMQRERTHFSLMATWRDQLEAEKVSGRVTVAEVEACVVQDPSYVEAKAAEVVAESAKVRLSGVMEALRTKKEMLISLGAHIRMEMQRDPLIRDRAAVDREVGQSRG